MKKTSKFNNIKTKFKGKTYDSKSEAKYAEILDGLLKEKKIKSVERQIRYPLPNKEGKMRLAFIADFVVIDNKGREHIIDVKGVLTPAANIKAAYFKHYYKKDIVFVYTTGLAKFTTDFLF